jgi:hypothetical protein
MMNAYFDNYLESGFVPFTFGKIVTHINNKGEEKKNLEKIMPFGWQNLTAEKTFCCGVSMAILTGAKSQLTVLDFDSDESYRELVKKYPEIEETYTVKTRKGFHCYFNYNPIIKGLSDVLPKIDARNDGNCIIAPPTKYTDLQNNICEYTILYDSKRIDIPQGVINDILAYKPSAILNQTPAPNQKVSDNVATEIVEFTPFHKAILDNINRDMYKDYIGWLKFLWAIRFSHFPNALELGIQYSRDPTKKLEDDKDFAGEEEIEKKMFDARSERIGWSYIMSLSKKSNPEKHNEIVMNNTVIFGTDDEASNYIIEQLKDVLLYSAGRHYYKQEHIWVDNSELVFNSIISFILANEMYKFGPKEARIPHWRQYSNAKKLTECVLGKTSLISKDASCFHTTTKYRLCFKNGVLDFNTKKFYPWNEVTFPYFSTVQIDYDYKEGNLTYMDKIMSDILEPLFNDNLKLALHYLSRSVAGCIDDKNFATYKGNRNCGKGVFYKALKQSLGEYVKPFQLHNIMCNRKSANEEKSVDLYWLLELEFARLAISQEISADDINKKIKSALVKKICSGGDTHQARRNYDRRDTSFSLDCSLMMMGNNAIQMEGDILEHHIAFESAVQFTTREMIDRVKEEQGELCAKKLRIGNPNIKTEIEDMEYSYAMIQILLNHYTSTPIVVKPEIDIEESVIQLFLKDWDIVADKSITVLGNELNYLGCKIRSELNEIGIEYKKHRKNDDFKNKWCYYGIQRKQEILEKGEDL